MLNKSASYNDSALEEYADSLLGQIYPPDKQCGSGSYLCRVRYLVTVELQWLELSTAVSNSSLNPLGKNPIAADLG